MSTPSPGPQQIGGPGRERGALGALLVLYLISALGFALATPYGEAPDEYGHLLYVEHLVRFGALPVIIKNPYSYEAVQPPLYYLTEATVVLIGREIGNELPPTAPLTPPIQGNPRFDPAHDSHTVLLHPADQRWLVWPLVLRGVSILFGLGVVLLTYLTARVLVPPPASAGVALIAAAFAALIPQANYIRASVSNENLADLLATWIIFLLITHLVRPYDRRRLIWIGVAYGLSILTKMTLVPFLALILPVLWVQRPRGEGRRFVRDLVAAGVPIVVLSGPYFLYNWLSYGDPLALGAAGTMLGKAKLQLVEVLSETFRWQVWSSFWGVYGWQTIWMPAEVYLVLAIITGLALAGGVVLVVRRRLNQAQQSACALMIASLLLMYVVLQIISLHEIVWQGRELYPALAGTCILFGLGLTGLLDLLPNPPGTAAALWRRSLGVILLPLVALGFFALNIYSIVWLVLPELNPR